MAKGENITTKFEVDISEFKKGISDANKQIKLANAQFKAASAGMDNWSKSSDGLNAKLDQLNAVLKEEEKKLQAYKKELQATEEASAENGKRAEELRAKLQELANNGISKTSDEYLKYQKALNEVEKEQAANQKSADALRVTILNQQGTVNRIQKDIRNYEKALADLDGSSQEAKSALETLEDTISSQESELKKLKKEYANVVLEQGKNSKEAKALAKDITDLSRDLSKQQAELNKAEKAANKLSSAFDDVGNSADGSSDGFTILGGAIAEVVGNIITGAISKIDELIGSLFELSKATEEYRTMQAKLKGSAKTFGYDMDFVTKKYEEFYKYLGDDQMAVNAITNLLGIGAETKTVSKLAEGATAVWASYGDSIPIESLTEAINETIQVGKVTGTFADTINWAKVSNEQMGKALGEGSKAQAAFNKAIAEGQSKEDAFSAALASTSDEQERADIVARFLNDTYGKSKKTYDDLNASVMEANSAETKMKKVQGELAESIQPVQSALTELKANALEQLAPVIEAVAGKFEELLNWFKENPAAAKAVEAGVIGLATALGILATALMIQALINGVQKAMALLNITMLANPYVLIAAAIAGLVAAFIYLWNTSDGFRQFWIDLWDKIKEITGQVVDAVVQFFTNLWNKVTETWTGIKTSISDNIQAAKEKVSDIVEKIKNKVSDVFESVKNKVLNIWQGIKDHIITPIQEAKEKASDAVENIRSKVSDTFESVKNTVKDIWESIKKAISDPIESAKKTVSDAIEKIKGCMNFEWSIPKPKIPHFSVSGGKAPWGFGGKGSLPSISVSWNKLGGIFSKPTLFQGIGEDGAEAVVPLERNTYWINKVAGQMIDSLQNIQAVKDLKTTVSTIKSMLDDLTSPIASAAGGIRQEGGTVQNITYNQTINAPKAQDRLSIYRDTNALLFSTKVRLKS